MRGRSAISRRGSLAPPTCSPRVDGRRRVHQLRRRARWLHALDVVSYAQKHNAANGEDNRDGCDVNHSWNHGVEGPSDDPAIVEARRRDVRNLLATLFVSRGTPMLGMGDELGRTQQGNNNGYAQDGPLTWVDWSAADAAGIAFVARLIELRKRYAALHEDRWLDGAVQDDTGVPDVEWRRPDGQPMDGDHWNNRDARSLVVAFHPRTAAMSPTVQSTAATFAATEASVHATGSTNSVAIAFNASDDAVDVRWPDPREGCAWHLKIDTALATGFPGAGAPVTGDETTIAPRSLVVVTEEAEASAPRRSVGVAREVLDRLAAAAGIAADWWDVTGKRHVVHPDTKRALLAAMGSLPSRPPMRARISRRWRQAATTGAVTATT
jgi:glycogen operon protein